MFAPVIDDFQPELTGQANMHCPISVIVSRYRMAVTTFATRAVKFPHSCPSAEADC